MGRRHRPVVNSSLLVLRHAFATTPSQRRSGRRRPLSTRPTQPVSACDRLLAPRLSPPAPCLLQAARFLRLGSTRARCQASLRGGRDEPMSHARCAQRTPGLRSCPRDRRSESAIALRLLMLCCVCPLTRALCVLLLHSCLAERFVAELQHAPPRHSARRRLAPRHDPRHDPPRHDPPRHDPWRSASSVRLELSRPTLRVPTPNVPCV